MTSPRPTIANDFPMNLTELKKNHLRVSIAKEMGLEA